MPVLRWRDQSLLRIRSRRLRRALARSDGISMVEVVIALVLLEIIGAALAGLLTSSTAATRLARQRTLAQQAALNQIETIRSMAYTDVGIVNGNPPGTLAPTTSVNTGGLVATLTTKVSYVNDPGPLSYTSYANYKKVVVTVRRNSDSAQLAQETTYVAPPVKASESNAVITARVVDYGNSTQVANVPVALSTGPSAPRNDTTDASGSVIFAGLTPNPTSGAQAYYDLSVTPPPGYVTLYDTVSPAQPAHVQLSPGQTWPTALYVYRPATVYVQLQNSDGTTFAGNATVTVGYTRNATPYSQSFPYAGSALTITSMNEGAQSVRLIPGLSYNVSVLGSGFYQYDPVTKLPQTSISANVPDSYPNVLTHTFTVTNAPMVTKVSVTVKGTNGVSCKNASVTISGGPWGAAPWSFSVSAQTSATGAAAVFSAANSNSVPANDAPTGSPPYYTVTATTGTGSGTLVNRSWTAGTSPTDTVTLSSGTTTC